MSQQARINVVSGGVSRVPRIIEFPKDNAGRQQVISDFFGSNVFGTKEMSERLPKPVYKSFCEQLKGGQTLDKITADAIAHAAKVWALERNATHFTHWFQPLNGTTAEKHDSFLALKTTFANGLPEVTAIEAFSGSELLQSEPDASSFPSGGMRTTFEARGYTVWDTKSPMFLQEGPHGTMILYIPSVFISYNGEALDEKSVLLRSSSVISKVALEILRLIEPIKEDVPRTKEIYTTLGTEQEYFLIDRGLYALRPDLKTCGRTLISGLPARHQQLEDHYFGKIPSRVLAAMSEVELECAKLGVPIKTRHNEVAPCQFEAAPQFEEAMLAVDHNLLTMDIMHRVAHKYKLKCLFHEKPFKGVNGSGKHCNWSIATDRGENLLNPSSTPETNYRFLIFLVAVLKAVLDHGDLLRAGVASASNDHRLGAQEAPPGIISVFLGSELTEVLNAIEEGRPVNKHVAGTETTQMRVEGTTLDLKVATLPKLNRDLTDRNRTSPFAFTGNKFEFRAVGSKQSAAFPVTILNSAVASALMEIKDDLKKQMGDKETASDEDMLAIIRKYITLTKNVRFEGDNYTEEWVQEAAKRGLVNITKSPEAFKRLLTPKNAEMLTRLGVFSMAELECRYHIMSETYAKEIVIEAQTLLGLLLQHVLPAAFSYRRELSESAAFLKQIGAEAAPELKWLAQLAPIISGLQEAVEELDHLLVEAQPILESEPAADHACYKMAPAMEKARSYADQLERLVADKYWPLPKYHELFSTL
ncbi:glutamine synthetase type III N terminal-domain-containing protein [Cokeromyces recurvatus]|uniref:glutamine synthetase type III N terminal-domain-containing protein n=1 Tax=Cokeromyces recurvatus TaxID=90255 RepID=UPI00221E3A51|nr:glutamine synthetase type III N terminal-domain-containing protein [Cokeromyces recurvatus]KAI7901281.1 glutamine synthetase type III N terminal-domain-containing protein [Cokeromyces recurvatus]